MSLKLDNDVVPENIAYDNRYQGMLKYSAKRGWQWARMKVKEKMGMMFMDVDHATDLSSLEAIMHSPDNEVTMYACRCAVPEWLDMFHEAYANRKALLDL